MTWRKAPPAPAHCPPATHRPPPWPAENLEQGRNPEGVRELRERVAAAASAAAEARLALQRGLDARRGELVARAAGLPCTLGDLAYVAWLHSFMLGLDQVGGGGRAGWRERGRTEVGCLPIMPPLLPLPLPLPWPLPLPPPLPLLSAGKGRCFTTALSCPPPTHPHPQLLLVAGTIRSGRAQRRDWLGSWLQLWRDTTMQR